MAIEMKRFVDVNNIDVDVDDGQTWTITDTIISSYRELSPASGEIETFRNVKYVAAVVPQP